MFWLELESCESAASGVWVDVDDFFACGEVVIRYDHVEGRVTGCSSMEFNQCDREQFRCSGDSVHESSESAAL